MTPYDVIGPQWINKDATNPSIRLSLKSINYNFASEFSLTYYSFAYIDFFSFGLDDISFP